MPGPVTVSGRPTPPYAAGWTVVEVGWRGSPADLPSWCDGVRSLLAPGLTVVCDLRGIEAVDLGTVDVLARLQAAALRRGGTLRVRCGADLQNLWGWTGLAAVSPLRDPAR